MIKLENKIYIKIKENNSATLIYPDYNIKTKAYIGENGCTYNKKEGDGKTPLGEFSIGIAFGIHSKKEILKRMKINYTKINKNMYWVDDSNSKYYNKLVDTSKIKINNIQGEHLIDFPIQYEYAIEIKTNPSSIPNFGSAIFLHCCSNKKYTRGCIAINREVMEEIMCLIDRNTKIAIKKSTI